MTHTDILVLVIAVLCAAHAGWAAAWTARAMGRTTLEAFVSAVTVTGSALGLFLLARSTYGG